MFKSFVFVTVCTGLILTGCSKSAAPESAAPAASTTSAAAPAETQTPAQAATVKLKDGTSFSGSVSKSDTTAITLTSADGQTRTYPMSQVESVKYGVVETAPAAAAAVKAEEKKPAVAAKEAAPVKQAPAVKEVVHTIPTGTKLSVRNNEAISADTASAGQFYSAVVAQDVADADGVVVIPKGSNAKLVVRAAAGQGKVKGQSELALDVDSVEMNGHTYRLQTADMVQKGAEGLGANKRTAEFTGGAAALGTIIGAVAGGAKGAGIGALAGGGAGAVAQTVTRGKAVKVPAETVLTFSLEAPVTVKRAQ